MNTSRKNIAPNNQSLRGSVLQIELAKFVPTLFRSPHTIPCATPFAISSLEARNDHHNCRTRAGARRANVGRGLIGWGGGVALVAFVVAGCVLYGFAQSGTPITNDVLIWDTVVFAPGVVIGLILLFVGLSIPNSTAPTVRRDPPRMRFRGFALGPATGASGVMATAAFQF